MSGTLKIAPVLAALALTAAALAGCTATSPAAVQTSNASAPTTVAEPVIEATQTPQSTESETCSGLSEVYGDGGGLYWERQGAPRFRRTRVRAGQGDIR